MGPLRQTYKTGTPGITGSRPLSCGPTRRVCCDKKEGMSHTLLPPALPTSQTQTVTLRVLHTTGEHLERRRGPQQVPNSYHHFSTSQLLLIRTKLVNALDRTHSHDEGYSFAP